MKVFFDFYEIAMGKGKSIGIYNYALAVLSALAVNNKNISLIVACSGENEQYIQQIPNLKIRSISTHYPTLIQRFFWRYFKSIQLAKKENADIYYSPKGFSPGFFKRKRKPYIIVTIHDMIPFYYLEKFPKYFGLFENQIITRTLRQSLAKANEIITISNFSREMILKYKRGDAMVHLIYNGVNVHTNKSNRNEASPYIFAITSNLPHKNKLNLIKGYLEYREITDNPLPIKICGITKEQLNMPLKENPQIEFLGFADQKRFEDLFSNAALLLFLPLIEGFGFPPLEAALYGIPAVVSDIPVLREILGPSAYFVDPENPEKISKGICKVLSDPEIAQELRENGKLMAAKYNWTNCGNQIAEVFEKQIK